MKTTVGPNDHALKCCSSISSLGKFLQERDSHSARLVYTYGYKAEQAMQLSLLLYREKPNCCQQQIFATEIFIDAIDAYIQSTKLFLQWQQQRMQQFEDFTALSRSKPTAKA